jgi:hypothetical protein
MKATFWRPGEIFALLISTLTVTTRLTADEPILLRERFPVGYQYHVHTRVDLTGTLTPPAEKGKPAPKPLAVKGEGAIEYDERVLAVGPEGQVQKTMRICRRTDIKRAVGDQPQEATLRPAVRRLVLLRNGSTEVPFSPDGPMTWGELDLIRTDVFTPALAGLLPDKPVRPGDRWDATTAAVQELTDMEKIDEGKIECRFEEVTTLEKRRHARVSFSGSVKGVNEDGPNRQQLDGFLYFDLESNHLSYLTLKGVHSLLKDGQEVGRNEGRLVLTRQANSRCKELADEALKGVVVEPNADNTLLLYDNPDLGVRFLYPRRWTVAWVGGNQVALEGADGSGLKVTLDPPGKALTGSQFLAESRAEMEKLKAKILRTDPPQKLDGKPPLEHFALEVEVSGQKLVMDYYLVVQANGGVTLAAQLPGKDFAALRREVERFARSIVITRKIEEKSVKE